MKTNTPTLPEAITQYLDATNRFDADSAAACFTPEATVQDDGKTYTGAEEIRQWVAQASEAYQPQARAVHAVAKEGRTAVTVSVAGSFPGSPVDLEFEFSLLNEKIAKLTIQ